MVSFGKRDAVTAGCPGAVRAARDAGFEAVLRLAGGRAAVFHEGTIGMAHAEPDPDPRPGIHERFRAIGELIARALRQVGVDARVGEVPGEYCPGGYSVNARGEVKLAGIGQRLIRGASHMGGVIVVEGAPRIRDVLVPVYRELGLAWEPRTAGAAREEDPGATLDAVAEALLAEYGERYELSEWRLDEETLALARKLAPEHRFQD
jgi:octanoyl-[GcvH]:protein N-octanoyltransferase